MGDIAWVRKYRPTSFEEYMGDDIKNVVINRFKNRDNIPNTIMLYGTRGTGKTSMARLLCKEILCLSPVDGHSCGQCDMCKEIDEYISATEAGVECTGITEVDAATTTGKSDINDIIEDALIPPMYPLKYKVIIMDECHMLSVSAQNSLLKVIEEPPKHLVFILCTTDPEKVIGTIQSRMQLKLEVKKKTVDEMVLKLEEIARAENLTISKEALQVIAKKGDRIPRECIMLLESIAKSSSGEVTLASVREQLGEVSTEIYMEFYRASFNAVAKKSPYSILEFTKTLQEKNIAYKDFIQGLSRFTLDCIYIKHGIGLEDYPTSFVKQVKDLFKMYNSSGYDFLIKAMLSAYYNLSTDDVKNELTIINTGLRVGKAVQISQMSSVERLVQNVTRTCLYDLEHQKDIGQNENLESIRNYQSLLDSHNRTAIDKVPETELRKEEFATIFKQMEDVSGGSAILDASPIADKDSQETADETKLRKLYESFGM